LPSPTLAQIEREFIESQRQSLARRQNDGRLLRAWDAFVGFLTLLTILGSAAGVVAFAVTVVVLVLR
jgi:hypothetical protein